MAETIRISDHTWRIEDGGVRFFVLEGTERAILVDSGMNTPDAGELAKKVTDKPLEMLNTHADRDHISGNGTFDCTFMSPAEEENFRAAGGTGRIVPLHDGDVIDLGGREIEIIEIPGHTPGSVALLDRKNRFLISGDSVQDGNIFMFGRFRDLTSYIRSMEKLMGYADRFDEIYPSHGTFPVSPDLIEKLKDAAKKIVSGEAEGEESKDMLGTPVLLYRFPFAGFLCEVRS